MKRLCTKCRRIETKYGRSWCPECLLKEYKKMSDEEKEIKEDEEGEKAGSEEETVEEPFAAIGEEDEGGPETITPSEV